LASELDEARLLLDTAERSRRHAENEVGDVREAMNELTRSVLKKQLFRYRYNFVIKYR